MQCSVCHMSKFHPHVCWSQHDSPGVPGALLVTNLDCVDGSGLTGLLPPPRVSSLKRGSGSGSADAGASVRGNWCQRLLKMWTCVIFGPLLLNTLYLYLYNIICISSDFERSKTCSSGKFSFQRCFRSHWEDSKIMKGIVTQKKTMWMVCSYSGILMT